MNILAVDDDQSMIKMISRMLESDGHTVASATNGLEAMEILSHGEETDLAIVDLLMPEKEGIETIIDIKSGFPHIKALAMSGGGRLLPEAYLYLAKQVGADSTLAKPFTRKDLLQAVEELFQKEPDVSTVPESL